MRAAGGPDARKPWLELAGRPVLEHAAAAVAAPTEVVELVVVAHADDVERVRAFASGRPAFAKLAAVVAGGAERSDSVRIGARAGKADVDVIGVHDAARPLVRVEDVAAALRTAHERGSALVALPVADTIKESPDGETVTGTLERGRLWAAQTPQCFRAARFLELLERAEREGLAPTDDSAVWERWEGPVRIVRGHERNRKLTTAADLELVRAWTEAAGTVPHPEHD